MPIDTQTPRSALDEIDDRGFAFYQSVLKDALERDHLGEVVAIHPDSSDYALGRYPMEAVRALRLKQPKGLMFVTRIGPPTGSDLSVVEHMDSTVK